MKRLRHIIATIAAHHRVLRKAPPMEPCESFARELNTLLDGGESVRLTAGSHPSLYVDVADDQVADGQIRRFIIVTQSAAVDGVYGRVPQIMFLLSQRDGADIAEPVTYENDRTGVRLAAYTLSATGALIPKDSAIRDQVQDLAAAAMKEIHARGYFGGQAIREAG